MIVSFCETETRGVYLLVGTGLLSGEGADAKRDILSVDQSKAHVVTYDPGSSYEPGNVN